MKWRSLEEAATQEIRSLREIYSERQKLIEQYVPEEIRAVHRRAIEELRTSGIVDRALKQGDQAPAFELPNQNGELNKSSDLLRQGPLVIVFFRGRWCPFCVGQMEAMNAIYPDIQRAGASFVAISPQTVHQSYLMADQHHLGFPLLGDAGNEVAGRFGLSYEIPEYQTAIYQRAFVNLPHINGNPEWKLPIPATYVVDPTGNIRYANANPDYTDRPEPHDLLELFPQLFS